MAMSLRAVALSALVVTIGCHSGRPPAHGVASELNGRYFELKAFEGADYDPLERTPDS
jgi:hypothetical protein